ncbi:MFS transporter [Bauldia litoralis]|uniref:Predicted arabinose efflux permease, MFS family n=1 Tax=Bauldia litoralis TaxID=665467 RepID=A0A1G6DIZ9_9HYPH|nr:MFS transporter [Bauldia litoralis]SDB45098.1 Predicted arabinose efflux permease, MFS family [Bauldia litoralis]
MTSTLIPIAALLLGSGFLLMAGGLHGLLLPVQGAAEGFTTFELGLIGTGWSVGFMAGCILVPTIVRRVGHVRGYSSMASLAAVAILLNILIVSPSAWITLRALSGFCFAGASMIVESWLNERATPENRGTVFSIYQMVVFGGSTIGQLLMVISPPSTFFFFAIGAILYCFAILPTALSTAQHPNPLKTARLDIRGLYANSPVAAVGCFMIGLVNGSFGTLGAVYAIRIGLPVADIALLMAGAVLGGALVQYPLGRLSDRMDRRRVLVAVAAAAIVVALVLVVLQPRAPMLVIGLLILFGATIYPMYGIAVAHANDFAAPDDFVKIAGGLLLLLGLGSMIGPILAAQAMELFIPEGLFAFAAGVHFLLLLYTIYRMTRRQAQGRELFQGVLPPKSATPESATLDPRADAADTEPPPPSSAPKDTPI